MSSVTLRRILHDIQLVTVKSVESLADDGIYYQAKESNIHFGTALIVGPKGTPYAGGFYFFSVEFPTDYPYSPLKIRTLTQDGFTRFNPNMYTCGKVCLSILNTWAEGPQWSGVQTLESVLRVIQSDVLDDLPLRNEPAYRTIDAAHPDSIAYNRAVFHANVWTGIHRMLTAPPSFAVPFAEILTEEWARRKEEVLAAVKAYVSHDGVKEIIRVYNMPVKYAFADVLEKLNAVKS